MRYFDALGFATLEGKGRGVRARLVLRSEWAWCASPEFRALLAGPVTAERVCGGDEPVIPEEVCGEEELVTDTEVCVSPPSTTTDLVRRRKEEEVKDTHTPAGVTG
jgi:hypothetical protein